MTSLSRRQRRALAQRVRAFSHYTCYIDAPDRKATAPATQPSHNPGHVNDGALLDLKTRRDATTHARRCTQCSCPLYRDELSCPLCGNKRVFFGFAPET
ncbi:MAG: hypothetical protein JO316_06840 [Abitibacteriaceae bacterium]|nr:hypothetical protein [Abditibacteriaceae bacterium]MBV9865049.1 hypothetical protein [Abditibacteriaceae bacterium]